MPGFDRISSFFPGKPGSYMVLRGFLAICGRFQEIKKIAESGGVLRIGSDFGRKRTEPANFTDSRIGRHIRFPFSVESHRVAGNQFMNEFRGRGRSFRRVCCIHDFATFPTPRLCLFPVRQGNQPQLASLFPFCPEDGLHDCTCCLEDG